jgi:hypothetical protein
MFLPTNLKVEDRWESNQHFRRIENSRPLIDNKVAVVKNEETTKNESERTSYGKILEKGDTIKL